MTQAQTYPEPGGGTFGERLILEPLSWRLMFKDPVYTNKKPLHQANL